MRKVSDLTARAFFNHKDITISNTTVKDDKFYLFGNCIAKFENNDLYVRFYINSNTTRERLNALGNIGGYRISATQRKFVPYLNGNKVENEMTWVKVNKV